MIRLFVELVIRKGNMSLKEYQKKREFSITPEPKGVEKLKANSKKLIFVIHDHFAQNHHHDLRLEKDGVLKSWAVPKLTPLKTGEKHLAIQVEDHPLEYADFKGTIPKGEYGAGDVKIFDKGIYNIVHETKNSLEINIQGKKVKGVYALIQFKNPSTKLGAGESKNWLFFKTNKK